MKNTGKWIARLLGLLVVVLIVVKPGWPRNGAVVHVKSIWIDPPTGRCEIVFTGKIPLKFEPVVETPSGGALIRAASGADVPGSESSQNEEPILGFADNYKCRIRFYLRKDDKKGEGFLVHEGEEARLSLGQRLVYYRNDHPMAGDVEPYQGYIELKERR